MKIFQVTLKLFLMILFKNRAIFNKKIKKFKATSRCKKIIIFISRLQIKMVKLYMMENICELKKQILLLIIVF